MPGPLRESHKIIMKGPAAAGKDLTRSRTSQEHPRKAFIQAPLINTWHLQDLHVARTSSRGLHQDLHKIF